MTAWESLRERLGAHSVFWAGGIVCVTWAANALELGDRTSALWLGVGLAAVAGVSMALWEHLRRHELEDERQRLIRYRATHLGGTATFVFLVPLGLGTLPVWPGDPRVPLSAGELAQLAALLYGSVSLLAWAYYRRTL